MSEDTGLSGVRYDDDRGRRGRTYGKKKRQKKAVDVPVYVLCFLLVGLAAWATILVNPPNTPLITWANLVHLLVFIAMLGVIAAAGMLVAEANLLGDRGRGRGVFFREVVTGTNRHPENPFPTRSFAEYGPPRVPGEELDEPPV